MVLVDSSCSLMYPAVIGKRNGEAPVPYTTATDQVVVTKNCPACRLPLHLVQDNTGSVWYHANAISDYNCRKVYGGEGDGQQ
jgi:hypothetical protein